MSPPGELPTLHPGSYRELRGEVRDAGLFRPRSAYYAGLGLVLALTFAALVAGLALLQHTWWVLLLAPGAAVLSTQIAFLAHDVAHRQVTREPRRVAAASLFLGNLLNGLSYEWWLAKHNAHHAHPNDLSTDPDVRAGAFVFDPDQAARRRGAAAWAARHQAALFFPALTLEAINLHVASLRAALRPGSHRRAVESTLLLVHLVGYVALLFSLLGPLRATVFIGAHQALFGVYLGCSFAPSHKGMAQLSPDEAADPVLRQVLASRNIRGGRLTTCLLGGLNHQIEHHLFPSMPRPCLRAASAHVRDFCERTGTPYTETNLMASYGIALGHLREVGTPLRRARRARDQRRV